MEKFALLLLLIVPVLVASQDMKNNSEELVYSEVIQVENTTKAQLYNRAKMWFATTYNDSKEVLQVENKENGQLVGNAVFNYEPNVFRGNKQTEGVIKYTIKLFLKEGRYKYIVGPFYHEPHDNGYGIFTCGKLTTAQEHPNPKALAKGWSDKVWKDVTTQTDNNVNALVNSFKKRMKKPIESGGDNW